MTEAEWLSSNDLSKLMEFLETRVSERKFVLFSCACCRRVWEHLDESRDRRVVEAAERIAEGVANTADFELRDRSAMDFMHQTTPQRQFLSTLFHRRRSRLAAQITWFVGGTRYLGHPNPTGEAGARAENAVQVALLREIVGNPFRPVTFDPAWRTWDAMALAKGIYDDLAFDRMPILADALQDAGCTSDDILNHLRDPAATHVRGCWALDLVLGKE